MRCVCPGADLEAKHGGLVRDQFGKLRRAKKGQPYVVPPNCGLSHVMTALKAKNIQSADSSKLICQQACPYPGQTHLVNKEQIQPDY